MALITKSTLTQRTSIILCDYFNSTHQIQLVRLWNGKGYSLEKIVFPSQRILFEAKPENILEVHTKQEDEQLLESVLVCNSLQVSQPQPQMAAI